jgi:hypothetical protein
MSEMTSVWIVLAGLALFLITITLTSASAIDENRDRIENLERIAGVNRANKAEN